MPHSHAVVHTTPAASLNGSLPDSSHSPAIEHWVATLLHHAPEARVAVTLPDSCGQVVRVYGHEDTSTPQWDCQIDTGMSVESLLADLDEPSSPGPAGAYAAVDIEVRGQVIGQLALSDPHRTAWGAEMLGLLGEAAKGIDRKSVV